MSLAGGDLPGGAAQLGPAAERPALLPNAGAEPASHASLEAANGVFLGGARVDFCFLWNFTAGGQVLKCYEVLNGCFEGELMF